MGDDLFSSATSHLSFEKFIATINQEQAKDLVRSINLWVCCCVAVHGLLGEGREEITRAAPLSLALGGGTAHGEAGQRVDDAAENPGFRV